ncbi:hypothetical protein BRADI_3g52358v3 [Brachypodium distachyon]|uniref:Uncharacterized protein n=1 Tax=Brachypodium distachyon TaxID=15368 RepID=A0A2K2D4S0_BRADI|nr:hypothetical protein BRADI_3g52358v3 [Brachypodium distachyon]
MTCMILPYLHHPTTIQSSKSGLPIVSAAAGATPEPVEPVPVSDDDLPPKDLRYQRAVRVALLAHPEVGDDPHGSPFRRAKQAERHCQLLAVRGDRAPLLLLAGVPRQGHLRRVGLVALEPELPFHLVEHLVDLGRPRVRPVLRREPVRPAVHLDRAEPRRLRQAPVRRLRPERGRRVPVLGPGVHVREDHVVPGVHGADAGQPLERALGELDVAVDPARVEQPARASHEVHHAAVVLRVWCHLVLQPHPVEATEPFLEQSGPAAGVQDADVHGLVGLVALPGHRVEHLERLQAVPVQREAGHHGAVRPLVLAVHRVEHRRGLVDAAALGVHVHQGRLHERVQRHGVPQQRAVDAPADVVGTQVRARRERAHHGALLGPPPGARHGTERIEAVSPQPGPRVRGQQRAPGSRRRALLGLHLLERAASQLRLAAPAVEADKAVAHVLVVLGEPELRDVSVELPPLPRGREPRARLEHERERVAVGLDALLQHGGVEPKRGRGVVVGDVAAHQGVVVEGLWLVERREDGRRVLHAARPRPERARGE